MSSERRAKLQIAGGGTVLDAVNLIVAQFAGTAAGPVTIAVAGHRVIDEFDDVIQAIVEQCRLRRLGSRAVAPPDTTIGAWLATSRTRWKAIQAPGEANRLDRVWLPDAIVDAGSVIALNRLPRSDAARGAIAIGIWAKFAHPRQRTGAWMSDGRDGLTAEIARAVSPGLVLLTAEWRGVPLVIASDDQVAAELAGLAVQQLTKPPETEPIGPWEDPLVQRATELGFGVSHPGQIDAGCRWLGTSDGGQDVAFAGFADDCFARIGVKIEAPPSG